MENLRFVFFRTGHPIRLVLDREDDMLITGGRHPLFGKYKVSIKDEIIKDEIIKDEIIKILFE